MMYDDDEFPRTRAQFITRAVLVLSMIFLPPIFLISCSEDSGERKATRWQLEKCEGIVQHRCTVVGVYERKWMAEDRASDIMRNLLSETGVAPEFRITEVEKEP